MRGFLRTGRAKACVRAHVSKKGLRWSLGWSGLGLRRGAVVGAQRHSRVVKHVPEVLKGTLPQFSGGALPEPLIHCGDGVLDGLADPV